MGDVNGATNEPPSITVLETHRPPGAFLRYIDQIVSENAVGIRFVYAQGMLRRTDIDVVHTTESTIGLLLGTRDRRGLPRLIAVALLAWRLHRHRIGLVRTLDVDEPP